MVETTENEDVLEETTDEGKKEEKIAIAKKMFSLNLPTSQIMQITGLTEEEINNLT